MAFLGVPQFVLIAAAVVAFGPWTGFAYSWIGTLVSSLVGFWLGRAYGARILRDFAGESVNKFMRMIGKNGFMASLIGALGAQRAVHCGQHGGRRHADAAARLRRRHGDRHRFPRSR